MSAAFVLSVLLALAACGTSSPESTPTADDTATSGPTTDPTDAAVDQPTARFGDGCAELVPASMLSAIFPFTAEPHDLLATEYTAIRDYIPRHSSVAQLGGMLCEWSNGQPYSSQTGASAFRGVQLAILPEATEGWERMVSYYGLDSDAGQVSCADTVFASCSFDVFEDGYWIGADLSVEVTPGTLAAVQALADHVRSEAAAFGNPAPRWAGDGVLAVSPDCDVTLPGGLVGEIFGTAEMLPPEGGGGWSLWAEAIQVAGNDWGCAWFGEAPREISVSWVNGGSWLATELGALDGTALGVPGMTDDDSATLSCTGTRCVVQLIVGRSWIIATVDGSPDPTAGATTLTQYLVDLLR